MNISLFFGLGDDREVDLSSEYLVVVETFVKPVWCSVSQGVETEQQNLQLFTANE